MDEIGAQKLFLPASIYDAVAIGDSAGGSLILLTIQALIAHELPVPSSAVAISPYGLMCQY
jgi:acetyl esterase/lipase